MLKKRVDAIDVVSSTQFLFLSFKEKVIWKQKALSTSQLVVIFWRNIDEASRCLAVINCRITLSKYLLYMLVMLLP